jgi:predicted transcriptional regulator
MTSDNHHLSPFRRLWQGESAVQPGNCALSWLFFRRKRLQSVRQPIGSSFAHEAIMTKKQIDDVLESVRSWPQEDQEELAEIAREIEARRTGIYVMTEEERAAVKEGLRQADRGEFVPDHEMDAFWKKYGVL